MKNIVKKPKMVSLATLRASRGMSQKDLAKIMDVSPGLIGLYETGKRVPSLPRAMQISMLFNVPLESISFTKIN